MMPGMDAKAWTEKQIKITYLDLDTLMLAGWSEK